MIEVRKAHELDIVELTEDLPEYGLRRGAQGTVVEVFDQPEEAYMIEFLEISGEISKIADWVKPNQIRNINAIAKAFYVKGMEMLSAGDFVEALRSLRRAVNLIPSYIGGMHNSLAQSIGPYEDWQRFIFAMQLVRLVDPDYEIAKDNLAIAYLNYGVQQAKKGNYKESISTFNTALGVEASHEISVLIKENISASYTALGIRAFHDDNMEEALVFFRSARSFASTDLTRQNFGKAHFHHANYCSSIGKLEMAIASYQHAEDAGLMFPEVLNNHAGALADDGRFVEARMILESAQAFAPEDEVIKLNLSTLHAINQASASSLETVKQNFITEDIRIDFLSFQMNTVPLRTAA